MKRSQSESLFQEAQKYIPGGVNSPVRAFTAVGGNPLFIAKAKGPRITDVDGNEFIDYVSSWGPMIFGHAHPCIVSRRRGRTLLCYVESVLPFSVLQSPTLTAKLPFMYFPSVSATMAHRKAK